MNRLSVRLLLAMVGVTLVTATLMIVPQVRDIAEESGALPPEQRPVVTAELVGRALLIRGSAGPGPFTAYLSYPSQTENGVRWDSPPTNSYQPVDARDLARGLQDLAPSSTAVGSARADTKAVAAASSTNELTPATSVSRSEVLQYVRGSLEQRILGLIGSGSLALALAVVLALLLARFIARPVETVTRAAGKVASGDLTVRIPVGANASQGSETTRLALSFNGMADSLQRLEQDRKNMVADVAHELRTPLTVMRGRLEAMEDGIVPLAMDEVRDLHAQVLVMARSVEDLRMLSLADAGKLSLELQDVDLTHLAQTVVAGYRLKAAANSVELRVHSEGPVIVSADFDRLSQVLMNLLENALRHTPAGGAIDVVVKIGEDGPSFEVRDSGPGIPPGSEDRIFGRFMRTDESRSRSDGGSGLGLAIVKAIVELHHGRVRAFNAASSGAVVAVQLAPEHLG